MFCPENKKAAAFSPDEVKPQSLGLLTKHNVRENYSSEKLLVLGFAATMACPVTMRLVVQSPSCLYCRSVFGRDTEPQVGPVCLS